jgi:transposase-like protein
MANPIALAAALARLVKIKCPYCKHEKRVARNPPAEFRVCPNCKRKFPDPLTARAKK